MIKTILYSYEWNDSQNIGHINCQLYNDDKKESYWRHKRNVNGWYTIKYFEDFDEVSDFAMKYKPNK